MQQIEFMREGMNSMEKREVALKLQQKTLTQFIESMDMGNMS